MRVLLPTVMALTFQVSAFSGEDVVSIPLSKSDRIIDVAVIATGQTYVLTREGIEVIDINERTSVPHHFDLKATVADPRFLRSRHQALAIDGNNNVGILWTGQRENGDRESYLTLFNPRTSTRIEGAFTVVADFSFASNGDIYILGLLNKQTPAFLAHQFSPMGRYVRSFHLFSASDESLLGQSNLIPTSSGSVLVMTAFLSSKLHEYRDGTLVRTYDIQSITSKDLARRLISMFSSNNEVYLQSIVGSPSPDPGSVTGVAILSPKTEIHVLKNSQINFFRSPGSPGHFYGLTADGRLVGTARTHAARQQTIIVTGP